MKSSDANYHPLSKILHWAVAGMIVLQYVLAQLAERAEHGDQPVRQLALLANHKSVGITILALALVRLVWRKFQPPPALPPLMPPWQVKASHLSHWALYLLLFALPVSGWLMSSASAYSVSWFNLFQLPDLIPASADLKQSLKSVHEILAKSLFVLALVHILAALKHGLFDRDGVMGRMASVTSIVLFVGLIGAGLASLASPGKAAPQAAAPKSAGAAVTETRPQGSADTADVPADPSMAQPSVDSAQPPADSPVAVRTPADAQGAEDLALWQIDYENSFIRFEGDQAGAKFEGRWPAWQAEIRFSAANLAASSFEVTIDTRQVDTADSERDAIIIDADWFDAAQFPQAVYRVGQFETQSNGQFVALGQLEIKGLSTPVELAFSVTEDGERRVIQANSQPRLLLGNALLDRLALGLGTGDWEDTTWVGQEVSVSVRVEAVVSAP